MNPVFECFNLYGVVAVQIGYDVLRVSFSTDAGFKHAMENTGVRLFGMWCPILGGGPPLTILHNFDYPFEESDDVIKRVCSDFDEVKNVKKQKYISNPNIFTGTRLVSVALSSSPPHSLTIGGYLCRVWYRGQLLVCNLCAVQGHKSADCPKRDKCRRCGATGHFAHNCTNAWAGNANQPSVQASNEGDPPRVASGGEDPHPDQTSGGTADPPRVAAEAAPSERAPPVAQTLSEDSDGVSPSDDYCFTCGQQVNEVLATEGSNGISDTQCVAAMSCASVDTVSDVVESVVTEVEQMIQEFVSDAANEGSDLQCVATEPHVSVVDGEDSGPGNQSILQAESSSAGVGCGTVSRQSPPSFSPLAYGSRELRTKARSVVSKFLQRNRSSPVSVGSKASQQTGGFAPPRAGGHCRLPVVVVDRPPSGRPRSKKT